MRTPKITKTAGEQFKKSVIEYLDSKGAIPSTIYDFQIETHAGVLCISPYLDWIATRFEDVERAKVILGSSPGGRLNPYSGKWNFHFNPEEIATSDALNYFAGNLERILSS